MIYRREKENYKPVSQVKSSFIEIPQCLHERRVNTGAPEWKRQVKTLLVQVLPQTAAKAWIHGNFLLLNEVGFFSFFFLCVYTVALSVRIRPMVKLGHFAKHWDIMGQALKPLRSTFTIMQLNAHVSHTPLTTPLCLYNQAEIIHSWQSLWHHQRSFLDLRNVYCRQIVSMTCWSEEWKGFNHP